MSLGSRLKEHQGNINKRKSNSQITNTLKKEDTRKMTQSTQGGEIAVYELTDTAWQVSSLRLHAVIHRHDYRLKHPLGRQDQKHE